MEGPLSLIFNDMRCETLGVFLYDIPKISTSNEQYESVSIGGRLGNIVMPMGAVDNITIECTFSVLNKRSIPKIRELKKWLKGKGILSFTETPNFYYEVLFVERDDFERELRRFGTFTVTFICYPYEFEITGKEAYKVVNNSIYNPFDISMPEYHIKGEGICSLTVNGYTMTANIGQNLIIDTRKQMAYRENKELENTAVTGKYEPLYLKEGKNEIMITDGFDLMVVPHWGCEA